MANAFERAYNIRGKRPQQQGKVGMTGAHVRHGRLRTMWLGSMERMNAEFLRVQKLMSVPGGMSPPKYTRSRSVLRRIHQMHIS